jgi:hypothetical protein
MKLSQIVQGRGKIVKADVVWTSLLKHIPADIKMDKTSGGGYVPTKGVLGNRERHRQHAELEALGKKVRQDYWQEWNSQKGVHVGFRDNRDGDKYNQALEQLAALVKKQGYRPKISKGGTRNSLIIDFDKAKVQSAEKAHGKYLAELKKKGGASRAEGTTRAAAIKVDKHTVSQIAKMTDRNDHQGALLEVAKLTKDKKLQSAVQAVQALHHYYGHMPAHLKSIKNELYDRVMAVAKSKMDEESFKAVHSAL